MNLLDAIQAGDDRAVDTVLELRPDAAREKGPEGQSAILMAVYLGHREIASRIATCSAPDLCEAAALGDSRLLVALLDAGASVELQSFDGWTALHLAAFTGHTEAARVLVGRGARLEAISANATANTPLCAALAGGASEDLILFLLKSGADANARAEKGVTPLHIAASRGKVDLVRILLANGADSTARMDDGTTPSGLAAARGHLDAARTLVSAGPGSPK